MNTSLDTRLICHFHVVLNFSLLRPFQFAGNRLKLVRKLHPTIHSLLWNVQVRLIVACPCATPGIPLRPGVPRYIPTKQEKAQVYGPGIQEPLQLAEHLSWLTTHTRPEAVSVVATRLTSSPSPPHILPASTISHSHRNNVITTTNGHPSLYVIPPYAALSLIRMRRSRPQCSPVP